MFCGSMLTLAWTFIQVGYTTSLIWRLGFHRCWNPFNVRSFDFFEQCPKFPMSTYHQCSGVVMIGNSRSLIWSFSIRWVIWFQPSLVLTHWYRFAHARRTKLGSPERLTLSMVAAQVNDLRQKAQDSEMGDHRAGDKGPPHGSLVKLLVASG